MNILSSIAGIIIAALTSIGIFSSPVHQIDPVPAVAVKEQNIGTAVSQAYALYDGYLSSNINDSVTSMNISPGTLDSGTSLSGYVCFVIDVNTPTVEYVCGTASSTSVTNLARGVDLSNPNATSSALAHPHRRFATVSITTYPTLQQLVRKANGTDSFSDVLSYDSGVTPTGNNHLADVEYVLSAISGTSSISFDREIQTGNAGETVSAGDILYLNSDGEWYKATVSLATDRQLGIAQGSGTDGNTITGGILVNGLDSNQSALTANTQYFLSTSTAGSLTTSTTSKKVGQAKSTAEILVNFVTPDTYEAYDKTYAGSNTFSGENTFSATTTFSGYVSGIASSTIFSTTTTGTWTKPANLRHVVVECQGAGGSGGTDGAGGGGGGYTKKLISASSLSATETITVGTASIGSGNTSFGSLLTCGNGGNAVTTTAGAAGTATGGDVNIAGQVGQGNGEYGGAGGSSVLGFGGISPYNTNSTSVLGGQAGAGYGAGGSGGQPASDGSPSGGSGGAGTSGIVIVTEYY